MSTGLKWSVLSTNSWQDMMDELLLYVTEKTKDGSEWDGNVPTALKVELCTKKMEKREISCFYQAGKLRKDRQMVRLQMRLPKNRLVLCLTFVKT